MTKIVIKFQSSGSSLAAACCCCFFLAWRFFVCCRFSLSKGRLCWLPFIHSMLTFFQIIYFKNQNTKKLFLMDVISVYTLPDAWTCVASYSIFFYKLWRSLVQIFLTVLNILSQNKLLWGIKNRNLAIFARIYL